MTGMTTCIVTLLALGLGQHALAFVPGAPRREQLLPTVSRIPFVSSSPASTTPTSLKVASLSLEDFMSGQDEEKRKKENAKYIQELEKRVERINALEPVVDDMGDVELQAKTVEFKERLAKGEDINGPLLEEAFAVVREAAW